jgi:hypothetical protein
MDTYAGHSWANGPAQFDDGNNEESSSEDILFSASLVLWGEVMERKDLRDLGIFLFTTQSLAALQAATPESRIERQRFRPNIELNWNDEAPGFVENTWHGKALRMGDVSLKVLIPSMRCVMTTLAQGDLPEDRGVLRAIVQANRIDIPKLGKYPCIGVYASLARKLSTGGLLELGAACRLE